MIFLVSRVKHHSHLLFQEIYAVYLEIYTASACFFLRTRNCDMWNRFWGYQWDMFFPCIYFKITFIYLCRISALFCFPHLTQIKACAQKNPPFPILPLSFHSCSSYAQHQKFTDTLYHQYVSFSLPCRSLTARGIVSLLHLCDVGWQDPLI